MSNWTEEKVEFLKKNWGLATARELAEKMGAGFTRNSIIGKASRLGLSAKIKTRTAASKKNSGSTGDLLPRTFALAVLLGSPVLLDVLLRDIDHKI